LIERFKLVTHQESKTIPVYNLVIRKGGFKLRPIDANLPAPFELYSNFHFQPVPGDATELRGTGTIGQLSDFLARVAGRPVVDHTGISGNFEFRLLCAIDGFPGLEASPSVFDAVQSQLGLKLEAGTAAVEITVVDHAEKPAEN
ncbi:MAG TPA: TIGR03435 family protein, partial [Candidatus Solibacter sp.]|nr:TIGR03435 family protein [Candidatus Solibacter sp.]